MHSKRSFLLLAVALSAGCGPSALPTSGRVTLDGVPLANAMVSFTSEDNAEVRGYATTNATGEFKLQQADGRDGLPAGNYRVRVTTYREGRPDDDPPIPGVPEVVPARYNVNSELIIEVKRGQAEVLIALEADNSPSA